MKLIYKLSKLVINMIIGYVYVITTDAYEQQDIYKIGCSKNVKKRLTALNSTRIEPDFFRIAHLYESVNYYSTEQSIHKYLAEYRLNNEFFKCSLDIIKHAITKQTSYFSSHKDWIIKYSLTLPKTKVDDDEQILKTIQQILSLHDKYNLYRFVNPKYLRELVTFYKTIRPDARVDVCFVNQFNNLNIEETKTDSPPDLGSELQKLKI